MQSWVVLLLLLLFLVHRHEPFSTQAAAYRACVSRSMSHLRTFGVEGRLESSPESWNGIVVGNGELLARLPHNQVLTKTHLEVRV
jgi:hypothetical protein